MYYWYIALGFAISVHLVQPVRPRWLVLREVGRSLTSGDNRILRFMQQAAYRDARLLLAV